MARSTQFSMFTMTCLGVIVCAATVWVRRLDVAKESLSIPPPPQKKTAPVRPLQSVTLAPETLDLGSELWGRTVAHELTLINPTDKTVQIAAISTSCNCTVVTSDYKGRNIPPSGEFPIQVVVDTLYEAGPKSRTVTVELADGTKLRSNVRISVEAAYVVSPDHVDFGNVDLDVDRTYDVVLIFSSNFGRRIVGEPTVSHSWIEHAIADRSDRTEVLVRIRARDVPPGRTAANILLPTDDGARPEFSVPVEVRGVQGLAVVPDHLFLSGGEAQVVRITDATDLVPVEIRSIVSPDGSIRVETMGPGMLRVHNASGRALRETVTVQLEDESGRKGRLIVSTF